MASSQLYASCPVDKSTAQIRLIHLQPRLDLDQEDIRCTLHLANLEDESTRYKALSYEWGPESETVGEFSITFDGEEVSVRENLYQALQYIRSETGEIKLWVDALCINQENQEERNHQVNYMGSIYSRADSVLAWLGTSDQTRLSGRGDKVVTDVTKAAGLLAFYQKQMFYQSASSSSPIHGNIGYFDSLNTACRSLLHLCKRTYWSRLWIIQELVLARRIELVCGNETILWDNLERFFARPPNLGEKLKGLGASIDPRQSDPNTSHVEMYDLMDTVPARILQQREKAKQAAQSKQVSTLFELFHTYRRASCTDIRDKVFGLRSLSRDCCQSSLRVDYSQSPKKVWTSVVKHYLISHQEILNLKGTSYQAAFYKMARDLLFVMNGDNKAEGAFEKRKKSKEEDIDAKDLESFEGKEEEPVERNDEENSGQGEEREDVVAGLACGRAKAWINISTSTGGVQNYDIRGSTDAFTVLLYDLEGKENPGSFSPANKQLSIGAATGFQSGDLLRKINDNEFIILRGNDSSPEIIGKARRKLPLFIPKKHQMDTPSMILKLNIQLFEELCQLNFESCGLRSVQASQDEVYSGTRDGYQGMPKAGD